MVVNQSWDATIRVVLGVLRSLLLLLSKVEEDGVICETELFEYDGDLPVSIHNVFRQQTPYNAGSAKVKGLCAYQPLGPPACE